MQQQQQQEQEQEQQQQQQKSARKLPGPPFGPQFFFRDPFFLKEGGTKHYIYQGPLFRPHKGPFFHQPIQVFVNGPLYYYNP